MLVVNQLGHGGHFRQCRISRRCDFRWQHSSDQSRDPPTEDSCSSCRSQLAQATKNGPSTCRHLHIVFVSLAAAVAHPARSALHRSDVSGPAVGHIQFSCLHRSSRTGSRVHAINTTAVQTAREPHHATAASGYRTPAGMNRRTRLVDGQGTTVADSRA